MIECFESCEWYVYEGKERPSGWNPNSEMDFCLDGKAHQCNEGDKAYASFFDSPYPKRKWGWRYGFENWRKATPEEIREANGEKEIPQDVKMVTKPDNIAVDLSGIPEPYREKIAKQCYKVARDAGYRWANVEEEAWEGEIWEIFGPHETITLNQGKIRMGDIETAKEFGRRILTIPEWFAAFKKG